MQSLVERLHKFSKKEGMVRIVKFAMAYCCGKDSALALHKMVLGGNEPVCLVVTVNKNEGRSWFHGADDALLVKVSEALGIPLLAARCVGDEYNSAFETALTQAGEMGAEACVFGDIDIAGHLEWNRERCAAAGLECVMPLWGISREVAVTEMLDVGFTARVKCVDKAWLDTSFLGETLSEALIARIAATGADICGENGEYHTFVSGGPIFKHPVDISVGEVLDLGTHAVIDIR